MRYIIHLIARAGNYLVGLSEGTKKVLVLGFLLLLGGSSLYKLVNSIRQLEKPLPPASPQQFIEPMQKLFHQASSGINSYQQNSDRQAHRLDSLARIYVKNNPVKK